MGIKSLEELKKIREEHKNKTSLRNAGEHTDETVSHIEILIGMATCGIAAGARETLNEIMEEISRNNIENIRVIPVGCVGFCKEEPIIQINIPGSKPVSYGRVKKEDVKQIIQSHILNNKPVESKIIHVEFNRA